MAAIETGNQSRQSTARDAWPVASLAMESVARVPADVRASIESASRQRWQENRERGRIGEWWCALRRAGWRRVRRLNAPVVYPWFVSARARGIEHALHRAAARLVQMRVQGYRARIWHRFKVITWPGLAALAVPVSLWLYGRQVRRRFGLGWLMQLRDVLRGAYGHGIFPTEFYLRRAFCEPLHNRLAHFFGEREMIELTRAATRGGDAARIEDTARFTSECRACGFTVPRTAAFFQRGELEFRTTTGPALLPEKDLVVRSVNRRGDPLDERWHWNPLSRQWNSRGYSCGARALFERFRRTSRSGLVQVQEALNNHPEMARYSAGALVEVRIATWVENPEQVEPLFAAMRMPSCPAADAAKTISFLEAAVDVRSGILSRAVGEFVSDGEFDLHPETGAVITGTPVPQWNELLDLARRAHRQFHDVFFVVWHIGLAGTGPVILGAGTEWETFPHALPSATRWAACCLRRLESGGTSSGGRHAAGVSGAAPACLNVG